MRLTTNTCWAQLLHRALSCAGHDADDAFEQVGLAPAALRDPNARYSTERMIRLWMLAADITGDPDFGLEVARCWHPTSWHGLGYAWLSSATLRDAFERFCRFFHLLTNAASFRLETSRGGAWLTGESRAGYVKLSRGAQDAMIGTIVHMCRTNLGADFCPLRVRFAYERPNDQDRLNRYFGAPIDFGAASAGIEVTAAALDTESPTANADLARANDHVVRDYLARFTREDLASSVRVRLLEQLSSGHACESSVASALHLTPRTLQRRLRSESTSYKQILDEVRRELATHYVGETDRSFIEITYTLGFSEPSNFSRAFKRWTGRSPSTYRTEHATHARQSQ